MQTAFALVVLLLNACLVGVGIYLASYLKKKAQNLATREEFADLKRQTAELARITGDIDNELKSDLWDRQKRFEMRRDFIFDAAKTVGKLHGKIVELDSACKAERRMKLAGHQQSDLVTIVGTRWSETMIELGNMMTLSSIVCSDELTLQFKEFITRVIEHGESMREAGEDFLSKRASDYGRQVNVLYLAMKKELAKPLATPQSSVSSAAPIPAPTPRNKVMDV